MNSCVCSYMWEVNRLDPRGVQDWNTSTGLGCSCQHFAVVRCVAFVVGFCSVLDCRAYGCKGESDGMGLPQTGNEDSGVW